ncbi:hypothetical protein AAFF_G00332780 [Aldrovandia affinis]|uniref:Uncharacterized protein n=1 Tax=Aldrovandia affinis TaxID=143900 RepID=A0AAD7WPQ8_9TELE|nr:hypothetical protein AAFF_G00332780 [Aldrovandia affinis]
MGSAGWEEALSRMPSLLAEEALDQAYRVIEFHREVHSLVEGTGEMLEVHYAIPEVATKACEPEALQEQLKIPTPEEVQYVIDALFKVKILTGNVGYLRFDMVADAEVVRAVGPQLLDLVWNKLISTDA